MYKVCILYVWGIYKVSHPVIQTNQTFKTFKTNWTLKTNQTNQSNQTAGFLSPIADLILHLQLQCIMMGLKRYVPAKHTAFINFNF